MRIGTLDNRITLQHSVLTRNNHGEDVETFTDYAEVWSKRNDLKGREYFAAQQMNSELTTEFTIRWRTDVVVTDRIVENGMSFNIRSVAEIPRHKGLILMATSVRA